MGCTSGNLAVVFHIAILLLLIVNNVYIRRK